MPYIEQMARIHLKKESKRRVLDSLGAIIASSGELNYVITRIVSTYMGKNPNYTKINEIIGVLECAKLELYRRIAAPYEDEKIEENGDVY